MNPRRLQGYLPIRFSVTDGVPEVRWCYLGDERLQDPFFDHTIERQLRRPFNQFFQPSTSVETLADFARTYGGPEPGGFIFHMSRCGSTLITQMLAALPQNIVLSEPSPIDSVLRVRRAHRQVTTDLQVNCLRWIMAALGQGRRPEEQRVFVKFDCWHVAFLPLLRQAFPQTPFTFLYRDPVEVMVSQIDRRGAQMLPGLVPPDLFGIPAGEALTIPAEEYCARVLACICRSALEHHRSNPMLLLNYQQLPSAVGTELAAAFGLEFTSDELELMRRAASFNAKQPETVFKPDAEEKRRGATPAIRQACEMHLDPLYVELEAARNGLADPVDTV